MAKLNLSQAAKAAGKNRTTIWRHVNSGKLSAERDRDGNPFIDTSELLRVYGELKQVATPATPEKQQRATPSYEDLIATINALVTEQKEMKEQIALLTNRLTHTPVEEPQEKQDANPENDPDWPAEVRSISDLVLRNEIKEKYL